MKQAIFYYNCAESYSSKGMHSLAKMPTTKNESLCEDALEIRQEILHYDNSLAFSLIEILALKLVET